MKPRFDAKVKVVRPSTVRVVKPIMPFGDVLWLCEKDGRRIVVVR